jgi:hypothetical protein
MLIGIDGSEEGYQNVASLLGWMRGNAVTAHSLDLALGNIINNPQFGRIHFAGPDWKGVATPLQHLLFLFLSVGSRPNGGTEFSIL